jgi:hypothetical protein
VGLFYFVRVITVMVGFMGGDADGYWCSGYLTRFSPEYEKHAEGVWRFLVPVARGWKERELGWGTGYFYCSPSNSMVLYHRVE